MPTVESRGNPTTKDAQEVLSMQEHFFADMPAEMETGPDCGERSYVGSRKLAGRKALITGGDAGVGRAVAIAYAREGADIALSYSPAQESEAQQVRRYVEAEGRKAVMLPGDLRDEGYARRMVREAHDALGGLDILAFVAEELPEPRSISEITTEQLEQVFRANVFSLFWAMQEAEPLLRPGTSILLSSSRQAVDASAGLADYAAAKGAVRAFGQALDRQFSGRGIRVCVVAPSAIWSVLQTDAGPVRDAAVRHERRSTMKPGGQPVELAPAYVYHAAGMPERRRAMLQEL